MQEMSVFSNTFLASPNCCSLLASARRNPYPCLISASPLPSPLSLAPPTHTHLHFGPPSALLFQEPLKRRKTLKGGTLSSLDRTVCLLLLRAACRCGEFYGFLFFCLPLSHVHRPLATGASSTSHALWGSEGWGPGAWEKRPSGFLSPLDASPAVSQVAAPAAVRVPGASD